MRAWFFLLVSLVLVVAACSSDERSSSRIARGSTATAAEQGPRVKPPADLGAHRAGAPFVSTSDGFAASGGTYEATVRKDGAFDVVPRTTAARPGPFATARGTALTLSTIGIARGERALDVRGTSFIAEDGSIAVLRGTIVERIENEGGGIEQSWRFDRAPAGSGDVVVRVSTGGERYRTSTDHGLHFDGVELGLRYGIATWIDARGARTTIVPRWADGAIELSVPHDVVERSAFPAVLDPTISAEREVDVPAAVTAAPGDQTSPSIVALGPGQGYFSVWHDRRSVRPAFVGARIATNGSVTDQTGVTVLSGVAATVSSPTLYASPSGLLLVWSVYNVDEWQTPGIYAVRIDNAGKALDAAPIAVAKMQNPPVATAAFDGTNWLLTWARYNQVAINYEIYGVRMNGASGAIADAAPAVLVTGANAGYSTQVLFDGTDYFLTWLGYNVSGLYFERLDKNLKVLGAPAPLLTSYPYDYSLGFDGNQIMLVWYEYTGGYTAYARRFDKLGAPNDGGAATTLGSNAQYIYRPRVRWDGSNFFATWVAGYSPYSVQGVRVTAAGALVEATAQTFMTTTGSLYEYAAASDGPGGVIVVREFVQATSSGSDVRGVKVTANGNTLTANAPYVVSAASNSETDAATAWNGTTYFSVWLDTRENNQTLWGAPIAADGSPGNAVRLFANPSGPVTYRTMSAPRIASNGSTFYVTFAANQTGCIGCMPRSVFGVVIDAQGAMQGGVTDLLPTGTNVSSVDVPDVAWSGADYLVAYQESSDGLSIAGRRVGPDGKPLDDKILRISPLTPGFQESRQAPAVAYDGTQFFVAWQTTRPTANNINVGHIYGTRVSKEGAALDGELLVCNAFLLQGSPRVAAHPRNGFFVVWDDYRTSLDSADVYGGRISSEGQLLDGDKGKPIANGDHDESRPTVVAAEEGTGWIVAWSDLRSKQAYDVYGAWISAAGVNRDPQGLLFSAEAGDEETPALTTGKNGKLLLTYTRLDPRTGYGSYRLRARAIDSGKPIGQTCANADECSSRACVDGFCCTSDCDGCGTCSATPGTCTARAAGTDSPRCDYKCKGTQDCPTECAENSDCAAGATCDKASKKCVTRQICIDAKTLQDLTGTQTDCAPYTCVGDACRTSCGSVDDCAPGFVCDQVGRCVPPPNTGDVAACSAAPGASGTASGVGFAAGFGALFAIASARSRRQR